MAQLEKQHASLIAEYETLHSIVHPKKDKKSQLEASDVASASATTDSELKDNQSTASLSRLNKLPALHQQIKLSKAGEQYASVLDRWLAFWLDSRVMDITATKDKTEVGEWYQLLSGLIGSESDLAENIVLNQSYKHTSKPKQNQNKQKDSLSENEQAGSVLFANSASQTTAKAMGSQLIPLSDLITTPKLGLWQQCYLYADENLKGLKTGEDNTALQMAAELIVQLPQFALIITASGWVMGHFGAIHLSKLSGESQNAQFLSVRLQQQQRLAVLEDQLNEIEAQMEQLSQQLKANQLKKEQGSVVVQELSAQLSTLTHSLHNLKQQQVELRAKQDRQNSEQQRLKQQRQQLDEDYQQLQQELTQLTVSQEQAKKELHTVEPKLIAVKDKQQQLQQQRQVISQQEREDGNSLRQLQLEMSRAELAEKHNQQQLQQLSIDLKQLKQAEQRLQQEQQKLQQQLPKLDASLKQTRSTHHEMQTALAERNAIINTLQTEANDLQQQRDDTEQQLQQQQQQLAETVTQVAIANERISEAGVRLTQVNNELTPETILTDYLAHGRSLSEVKLQKLQSDDLQLSAKLNNMGPVNLAAAAELAAVDERLLPLEQQINDITASMATLTDAIASIDAKTKTLFLETLDSVNESLTNLFTKVFGGGQASLTLSKEEGLEQSEQWRAGLELMAQPKGKKNSRLAVLSGGEKTLTALSLIFAIFKQHPAPFCVLDEVDAPLDDANVMRFTNLISDLADEVQFIFISHNKLAMQIADELKGVTMPQPGISTLVSVSLEEAEQYLDPTA